MQTMGVKVMKVEQGQDPDDKRTVEEFAKEKNIDLEAVRRAKEASENDPVLKGILGGLIGSDKIKSLTRVLNGASEDFMSFASKTDQKAMQVTMKRTFQQIAGGQTAANETKYQNNIQYVYQKALQEADPKAVVLPLTAKFQKDLLHLASYKLQLSHCFALNAVFKHRFSKTLRIVFLE